MKPTKEELQKIADEMTKDLALLKQMISDIQESERELTDIKRGNKYYFIDSCNGITSNTLANNNDSTSKVFPLTLRTRSKEHLESMKKYRDATSAFMAKCHEVNLADTLEKNREVFYLKSAKKWVSSFHNGYEYQCPLMVTVSDEGAKKLIEWCKQKYPDGLNWSEL